MGYRVTMETFDHSKTKGGKLLILLAIAETASNDDAVAFGLDQGWKTGEKNARRKRETIAGKARLRPETVSRLITELVLEDELEVRFVQQHRARSAVYRITLGLFRDLEVDVDRLERYGQRLDRPFSTPEELALPWPQRPANLSGSHTLSLPEEMSGGHGVDDLTSEQRPPDIDTGDDLTSTADDAPLYAGANVQGPVQNSSLTSSAKDAEEVPATAGEQAGASPVKELVRAFALKLDAWPQTRIEWSAWMKAFSPLADQGVEPDELSQACESYLAYHRRLGRDVELTPFAITKHWQAISQSLERHFFTWMRWATEVSWRLPVDEADWLLEQATTRVTADQALELAAMVRRTRDAHSNGADDVLRWVEAKGWALDDDDWRRELTGRLPRNGGTELRRVASHRRHEMRRDLARLRAGLALPAQVEAA